MEPRPNSARISRLRIGLLVDSVHVPKYVYEFVKWAQMHDDVLRITHLILHPSKDLSIATPANTLWKLIGSLRSHGIFRTASNALYKLIIKIETVMLRKYQRYRDHLNRFDLSGLIPNQVVISPIISKSGLVYRFGTADVQKLEGLDLDILVRCGSGILRGGILKASRFGVISFHHADNRINRGGPAGFWEVYFRQDTTGFTIQRLTEELDGGDVLMRGHFPTRYFYLLNQAALFEKANSYLESLVHKIAVTSELPRFMPSAPYSNKLFRMPTAYQACIYLFCLSWLIAKKTLRRVCSIDYRWNVAYAYSDWKTAVLWRGKKIKNPPSHFLADPFVASRDGKDFCFVEDFDYQTKRGKISVYKLTLSEATRIGTAIEEPFHMSFPFLFEYKNDLFMCPETSENRDIRIYKCIEFPLRWALEKIAMKNVAVADTMLFEKNGKWWMFTNADPVGDGDYSSELSIFYADSPFADCWTPHFLNPIIVDAARARNAGLAKSGDTVFRISQGQGFDFYGKRALINEIIGLTSRLIPKPHYQ